MKNRTLPHPGNAAGTAVRIQNLHRAYGDKVVLDGLSVDIAPGETLALLGPSGCGKTTLLKILAGLEQPSHGEVWMGARCVANAQQSLVPEQRGLGMVFQDYALWPHMSVRGNVGFALRMCGVRGAALAERVDQALALVGLQGMGDRAPSSLSGGQQQRVALARAIVARPQLILFDEPLSNLDRDLRESLCTEMRNVLRELGCTAVYVTHDHEEACTLADRVAVVMHGRFHQIDTPQTLWSRPATREVAQFLKLGTLLDAHWQGTHWQVAGMPWLCPPSLAPAAGGAPGQVLLPHAALQLGAAHGLHCVSVHTQVVAQHYRCGQFETWVDAGWPEPVRVSSREHLQPGTTVALSVDVSALQWFAHSAPAMAAAPALHP